MKKLNKKQTILILIILFIVVPFLSGWIHEWRKEIAQKRFDEGWEEYKRDYVPRTVEITLSDEEMECEECEECETRIIKDCIYPVGCDCPTFPIKICRYYESLGDISYPCDELIEEIEIEGILFYKVRKEPLGKTDLIRANDYTKKFYIEEIK